MKKIYETPLAVNIKIECGTIIATSPSGQIGIDSNSIGDEQLSAEQRGGWGNIWKQ